MGCLLISDPASKLAVGVFSDWLETTRSALQHDLAAEVPCGECRACCHSSFFIHIRPDELETLSHIPSGLLFPAPGLPKGNVLMGFDEKGRCPMLKESGCSIYEHRPLTCRSYDCRVLPAAGVKVEGKDKSSLAHQITRWEFDLPDVKEDLLLKSVRRAASFLRAHARSFPEGEVPANPTQLAIMAIKVHELFLDTDKLGNHEQMVQAVIEARNRFDEKG